jgi:hypothetical protein
MDRRDWIKRLTELGVCTGMLSFMNFEDSKTFASIAPDKESEQLKSQKEFIQNWLSDLLESMDKVIDRETQVKIIEGCGKGCFNRHKFKQDIAVKGKDNLDELINAYKQNFEIWKEGDIVHIRYGEVSSQCYCPAANYRAPKENDLHCECTRMTHQTIFETALGRPFKVDVVESLRRGGKTCHFAVHLS